MSRKIAFPSNITGLKGEVHAHFGHADAFTLIEYNEESKDVISIEVMKNAPHVHQGCMGLVMLLKNSDVDHLGVIGIGPRPLTICNQVGIEVLEAVGGKVKENFQSFLNGKLNRLKGSTCKTCEDEQ